MTFATFGAMMALALAIDAAIGWPVALYRRIGHPVTWIGALISGLEARWNHGPAGRRRRAGVFCVVIVGVATAVPAIFLQLLIFQSAWGAFLGGLLGGFLAWPWIAARSLYEHVARVAAPLAAGDLDGARAALAMIVGRDPSTLDGAGVARAAIESLAENASDGVVAPLFWGAVAGLPGLVVYKAVNTLDSMIGHRSPRYEDFGRCAARLDDVMNLIPARLTGAMIVLISGRARQSARVMARDARQHRSPNAGWPEAAMAGALGIRLSGPRVYGDRVADEPWLNAAAPDPGPETCRAALSVFVRAMVLCGACLVALAVV